MWYREHDGKVMAIGEYVDHLTGNEKVDLFGGGPGESVTIGQSIDAEIRGYMEECCRLSGAVMLGRRLAESVIASGGRGRLPGMAQKLMEMTKDEV